MDRLNASRLAVIGLGSSLGDRRGLLRLAVGVLASTEGVTVERVSRPVVSRGLGPALGPFLNAAVRIRTVCTPLQLLAVCKRIERRLGRRPSRRWADRAIDCDVLLIAGVRFEHPQLQVPHPRFFERRFAVGPAREVAPEIELPGTQGRLRDVPVPPAPSTWWSAGLGGHLCGGRVVRRA